VVQEVELVFHMPQSWPQQDLIAVSPVMDAATTLRAYREGVFPMPLNRREVGWFSPMRRGVMRPSQMRVSKSLRQSARKYRTSFDLAFPEVISHCADPSRPLGWIDDRILAVYNRLHRTGVVHSVETWSKSGRLVGGLYGVSIGGLFCGESMFHDPVHGRDASKVALLALVERLDDGNENRLIDTQWQTPHLASLGVVQISRDEYLGMLPELLAAPLPHWDARGD
jgi:leucyl/phenylalanyl-tRNA--protein transferase